MTFYQNIVDVVEPQAPYHKSHMILLRNNRNKPLLCFTEKKLLSIRISIKNSPKTRLLKQQRLLNIQNWWVSVPHKERQKIVNERALKWHDTKERDAKCQNMTFLRILIEFVFDSANKILLSRWMVFSSYFLSSPRNTRNGEGRMSRLQ